MDAYSEDNIDNRIRALKHLSELTYSNEEQFCSSAIEEAVVFTRSQIGYLHFINDDENSIQLVAWSNSVHAMCEANYSTHYPVAEAGIWADCVRFKRWVIHNDYLNQSNKKGLPEGHFPLINHMSVPVIRGGKVKAVIGVGNRDQDFTHKDAEMLLAFTSVLWSIIEQKRNLHDLEEHHHQLEDALEAASAGSFHYHLLSDELLVDNRASHILCLKSTFHDSFSTSIKEYIAAEDWLRIQKKVKQALTNPTEHNVHFNTDIHFPDHSLRHLKISGHISRDNEGKPIWIDGLLMDVTDQYETEEQLQRAAAVFANSNHGILITNVEGVITDVNDAFVQLTGYTPSEVIGQKPSILASGEHGPNFFKSFWKQLLEQGAWSGEISNRNKQGVIYIQRSSITAVKNNRGEITHFIDVFHDITDMKQTESALNFLAHFDPLTRLPNRTSFNNSLKQEIARCERNRSQFALLFMDLDHFKFINDSMGHDAGDSMLRQVAQRIHSALRRSDIFSRQGGDEFTILITDHDDIHDVRKVCTNIIKKIKEPFVIKDKKVYVGITIGVAFFPDNGRTIRELISNADAAMYEAKKNGRNNFNFYTPMLTQQANERVEMEAEIRYGLENREFVVYFQPQLCFQTGRFICCEALLRWHSEAKGVIGPDQFIPIAEQTDLILKIGEAALTQACTLSKPWVEKGWLKKVAVNVSGRQMEYSDLEVLVESVLKKTGFPAQALELEITETILLSQGDTAVKTLEKLQSLGVTISIDDFGTGYSSLSQLQKLPVKTLKIDKSFVQELPYNIGSSGITRAIIEMSRALQMTVVAEGVETLEQELFLKDNFCTIGQGYLYSKPVSAAEFELFMQAHRESC